MKRSIIFLSLLLSIGFNAFPAHAQVGMFDQAVDWINENDSHLDGEAHLEGAGDDALYRVLGNGSYGGRVEHEYNMFGDEGYYLYTEKTGSWTLQAKLYPVWGPCALMIRESGADSESNFYSVQFGGVVGESVNALFRTRIGAGGNVSTQLFDSEGNPIEDTGEGLWFRVTRIEPVDVFFGEFSPDGEQWFIADNRVIQWSSDTAAFGIAVGSGANDEEIGEVEATHVEFVSPPPVAQRILSQQSFKKGDSIDVTIKVFVAGSDRSTATIQETVPDGWTISNISNNGTANGSLISWNLSNLPIGETTLTYQVSSPAEPADLALWSGVCVESVNILGPKTIPLLDITGGDRVTDGLLVLYTFDEGNGNVVHDVSEVGEPLDLIIADETRAVWENGYLETTGVNHIESPGTATKIIEACRESNEITVEAWIKTSDLTQNGTARIITCSIDSVDRNFTMGQGRYSAGGDRFEMRYRAMMDVSNPNQVVSVNTHRGTLTEALTHIVFTREIEWMAAAYINNVWQEILLEGSSPTEFVNGDFTTWDDTYKFGLGNEIASERAWLGQFHLVAVYSRALTEEEVSQNFNAGPFVSSDMDVNDWAIY